MARAGALRGPQHAALVALHDHDQHEPERDLAAPQAGAADRLRPGRRSARRPRPAGGRVGLDGALRRRASFGLQDGLAGPEARYEQRESVELAFIAALQHLPANQRAVLILRDVLGFSAKETAETLETTVASANSALQRARASVDERLPEQSQQATLRALGDERLNELVDSYMKAWESCDVDAVVGMLTEDACFSMPPLATWFGPRPAIETFLVGSPMSGLWRWKSVRVRSNGQVALAFYSWDDDEGAYLPFALNVLTFRGELISDVTAFIIRTPPEEDDREVILRMPEQPTSRSAWRRRSRTSAFPIVWTEAQARQPRAHGCDAAAAGERAEPGRRSPRSPRRACRRCARRRPLSGARGRVVGRRRRVARPGPCAMRRL